MQVGRQSRWGQTPTLPSSPPNQMLYSKPNSAADYLLWVGHWGGGMVDRVWGRIASQTWRKSHVGRMVTEIEEMDYMAKMN